MKKCISFLIVALFMLNSLFVVSADSTDVTKITIEENDDLHVKVKVTTTVNTDKFTIKIHGSDSDVGKDTYLKQKKTPDSTDENGVHTYTFNFNAITGANSGLYKITCSTDKNNPVEFRLRTDADKEAFYDALDGKTAGEVAGVMNTHKEVLPDGLSGYEQLGTTPEGTALRTDICEKIADETYTVLPDSSNLDAIDELFCNLYSENIILSNLLCEGDAAEWKFYAQEAVKEVDFDGKYLANLDAEVLFGNFSQLKGTELNKTEITEAYDKATMLSVVNSFNSQLAREAIEHFGTKGTSGLSFTDYNNLSEDNKVVVCDTVKEELRETFTELKDVFEGKAEDLNGNGGTIQEGTTGGIRGDGAIGGTIAGGGGGSREEIKEDKPQTPAVSFNDIGAYDWAKESIIYLAEKGVLNGRGNNEFAPGDSVTKEEFVKIIVEAFAFNMDNATADFNDVSKDRWSYKYIASAYNLGIITGESNDYFGASTEISRQDMAVILERVLKIAGIENNSKKSNFSDYSKISDYAKNAVNMLSNLGIINGMGDGTYAPKQPVTRAQAAKVVYEVLGLIA